MIFNLVIPLAGNDIIVAFGAETTESVLFGHCFCLEFIYFMNICSKNIYFPYENIHIAVLLISAFFAIFAISFQNRITYENRNCN